MPINNLARNIGSGSVSIDRQLEAPVWIPFGSATLPPGSDPIVLSVPQYIASHPDDIASVAVDGSVDSTVFAISGTWGERDLTITATPRATVTRNRKDSIRMVATGVRSGTLAAKTAVNTFSLTTIKEGVQRVFWKGNPARTLNEGQNIAIGLSQFIGGIPDDTFDSVEIVSKSPDVQWIALENANTSMAQLRINHSGKEVSGNTNIQVALRVNKSTASPTSDETMAVFTILDIVDPLKQGISITGYDLPSGIQKGSTFPVKLFLDAPLEAGDSLQVSDFTVDGLDGVAITSVAKDSSDTSEKTYIITCSVANNIRGIVNIRYNR